MNEIFRLIKTDAVVRGVTTVLLRKNADDDVLSLAAHLRNTVHTKGHQMSEDNALDVLFRLGVLLHGLSDLPVQQPDPPIIDRDNPPRKPRGSINRYGN